MKSLKDQILELRVAGKSYREIEKLLNCSKSTISYYCDPNGKDKTITRKRKMIKANPLIQKVSSFKLTKNRLKCKAEKFQLRDNTQDNRMGNYDSDKIMFNWGDVIQLIIERPTCYLTGDPLNLDDANQISLDHIVPVSKGGTNELSNLGVCTRIANMSKTDMSLIEYIEHCKKVLINFGYTVSN